MAQFDVYRNPAPGGAVPYLLDVQCALFEDLATRVVVPLVRPEVVDGKPASHLNPVLEVEGTQVVMLTQELAGIARRNLGERVGSLAGSRQEILGALDFLLTGF